MAFLGPALLILAMLLFLNLWTEQSSRYYQKLYHGYLVVATEYPDLFFPTGMKGGDH